MEPRVRDDCSSINVALIGVGVVGAGVLDFFGGGPLNLTLPGGDLGGPTAATVKLWSAARRSASNSKAASADRIGTLVTRREDGTARFFYDEATAPEPAWRSVVRDPNVDIVVELTGSPVAEAIIEEALWNGKCVVTANKAVVARSGHDLVRLARSRGVILAYEAAVGGGMPVVQTIASSVGGEVEAILAILNGTTNFILSKMMERANSSEAGSYQRAVCAAIHGGLAEADPGADVLGDDARSKIIILSGLAFGVRLRPQDVYFRGISRRGPVKSVVTDRTALHRCPGSESPCTAICADDDHLGTSPIFTASDLATLQAAGLTPKLLAGAQRIDDRVVAWAQPAAVPLSHALGGINDAENGCLLDVRSPGSGKGALFKIALRGPGAGGPETASSVIADILFCARQLASHRCSHDGAPYYMYGADSFSHPQGFGGVASLLAAKRLQTKFLIRFDVGPKMKSQDLLATLQENGVEATIDPAGASSNAVYLRTGLQSMQSIEHAIGRTVGNMPIDGALMNVLYLPIIEGTGWEVS